MRKLHAVGLHEKFVASGEYRTYRDDDLLGITEQWTIHEVGEGGLLFRVDEDGREEDGLSILSEALISPDKGWERFNVQSFSSSDPAVKLFKADYSFEPDYVQIGRKLAGQEREYDEFAFTLPCVIYVKQMVYMGLTIREVMASGNKAHVFTPQLLSITDSHLEKIITQSHGMEAVQVGNKSVDAEKVQVADDTFYWLDAHDIPVRRQYRHAGATYRVTLHNYAHR